MEFSAVTAGEWTTRMDHWYGAAVSPVASARVLFVLGAAAALVPSLAMWGFTVDDALISVRYAHNVATSLGYRFDPSGAPTDGVTPLPWPFLLAPFARGDALATLTAAKVLGTTAWTMAAAALGAHLARVAPAAMASKVAALVVLALAFPIGAWAASGMETGVATALATLAVVSLAQPRRAALLAGASAALRPEMLIWAVVLACGAGLGGAAAGGDGSARARRVAALVAIASVPFALCAAVRLMAFGRAAPLAVLAKPSDLGHGSVYAAAACVVVLLPILVCSAPVSLARAPREARIVALAFAAHVAAVALVGGDWMPYARLVVPVAPSLTVAFVASVPAASRASVVMRVVASLALGALLAARAAPAGRGVAGDRADLVARARPVLRGARVVAALDIGWVSAATDARLVDLAGLTDPAIAALPGGHTSKRVDASMLLDRGVDAVVVYSELRVVEARLVRTALFAERFEARETLPLGDRGAVYTVYRRRPPARE